MGLSSLRIEEAELGPSTGDRGWSCHGGKVREFLSTPSVFYESLRQEQGEETE